MRELKLLEEVVCPGGQRLPAWGRMCGEIGPLCRKGSGKPDLPASGAVRKKQLLLTHFNLWLCCGNLNRIDISSQREGYTVSCQIESGDTEGLPDEGLHGLTVVVKAERSFRGHPLKGGIDSSRRAEDTRVMDRSEWEWTRKREGRGWTGMGEVFLRHLFSKQQMPTSLYHVHGHCSASMEESKDT